MRAKSAQPVSREDATLPPPSPEHPAPTGSVAIPLIAQPGQGDLGAPPQLVGLYEVVQALLGLLTIGLLARGPIRRDAPIATKFCIAPK
jgi:hypothetical protein